MLHYSNEIPVNLISNLFNKMSDSYKLFWFKAIVDQVYNNNLI